MFRNIIGLVRPTVMRVCGEAFFPSIFSAAARSAVPLACVTSPATARPFLFSIVACPM